MDKRTEKLLEYFKEFKLVDLLAFGKILEVQEEEKIEDFVTNILVSYNEKPRAARRQLVKLAKDIVMANRDIARGGTLEN